MALRNKVQIIGSGLAGCEAAYYLANKNIFVELFDVKPQNMSPAHSDTNLSELVCSNSLKSDDVNTASGLLKYELRKLNSFIISVADSVRVPAGNALAVDRKLFAKKITDTVMQHENIKFTTKEVEDWDTQLPTIIATGPLTFSTLHKAISEKLGEQLYFYDAAAPIITADSIDNENSFFASRYNKGADDYINCPLEKDEYELFFKELITAECAQIKDFEKSEIFDGCMPIEVMAKRGIDTLRFGPLKPVGFINPKTNKRPYAVIQLRKENCVGSMYNIVGFQTNLKFNEQKRVFSIIPALKNAEFCRYGVMHRNTFINAPNVINKYFQTKKFNNTFIAGQLSGVEGYVESIASGLISGMNIYRYLNNQSLLSFPTATIIGALTEYLSTPNGNFQPMNANYGILPELEPKIKDKDERKKLIFERDKLALQDFIIYSGLN